MRVTSTTLYLAPASTSLGSTRRADTSGERDRIRMTREREGVMQPATRQLLEIMRLLAARVPQANRDLLEVLLEA
jgi:hypothetical protein